MRTIFVIITIATNTAFAQTTLPEGIWHPRLILGNVKEISSEFNNEGELNSIGRFNQTFDSDFVKKFIPEFSKLVDGLNMLSPQYNIGDRFNLGRLEFSGGFNISYVVPALAYGITDKWTVGIALPVITLRGNVKIVQNREDANDSDIRRMLVRDGVDFDEGGLDEAFDRLNNINLINEFNAEIQKRGYDPLTKKHGTGLGDLQILNVYNYFKRKKMDFYLLGILNLPTGIEPNPDDLMSINEFNKAFLNLKSHHERKFGTDTVAGTALGTTINFPDKVSKRVPENSLDILPKENRKEKLTAYYGTGFSLDLYVRHDLVDFIILDATVAYNFKGKDKYKGTKFSDYSLLSDNTDAKSLTLKMGVTFNTSKWFMQDKFSFPFMINYSYSDVLAGHNVIRQSRQELSILLFF